MRILGIETSCDETAICLLEAEGSFGPDFKFEVPGNALHSQAELHAQYGGVFPMMAKREHAKNLVPILMECLSQAQELRAVTTPSSGATLIPLRAILEREPELFAALVPFAMKYQKPEIDAIAVTHGPGLEPTLWVGINFAKALAQIWNIPVVAVNHMEGHIILPMMKIGHSDILENVGMSGLLKEFDFPVLSLLISGGHTELVLSKTFGQYQLIGQTRDDAAGEAFDKVARLLGLAYPGGPEISRLAAEARSRILVRGATLPRPMLNEDTYDFSFSGLKTAVRRLIETAPSPRPGLGDGRSGLGDGGDTFKMQLAREFEDAVTDVLIEKTMRAADEFGVQSIVVGGGVSANAHIRQRLAEASAEAANITLLVPPPEFATDNAIMIALAGYFHAHQKEFADPPTLTADGNLKLS